MRYAFKIMTQVKDNKKMPYFRVNDNCNGCLACVENCPAAALDFADQDDGRTLKHNMTKCARCGQCWRICPQNAIEFQHLLVGEWDEVITLDLIHCRVCGEPLYSSVKKSKTSWVQPVKHFVRSIGKVMPLRSCYIQNRAETCNLS
jgi:NAD-dependent dihydropyrimidine dehydrogenase PreA subunit